MLLNRICFIIAVYIGAVGGLEFVWSVADTLNAAMALPNLVGILLLSGVVIKETKRYFSKNKTKVKYE